MEPTIATAFLIGLLGSTHCIGMCGGIVGALNIGTPEAEQRLKGRMQRNVGYNLGRITSYTIAGVVVAAIAGFLSQPQIQTILPVGQLIAALVMIALGLYFLGWAVPIRFLESAGSHIWRKIEPFGRTFLPARTPWHAFGLGLVWGWLPCGLVYSALALALASGTPTGGAMIMASFGLGTLPMLLLMGQAADTLVRQIRQPVFRHTVGIVIIALGIYSFAVALSGQQHNHNHEHHGHGVHSHLTHIPILFAQRFDVAPID